MSGLNEAMSRKYGTAFGNYLDDFAGMREMLSGRIGYHSYWSDRLDGQLIQHRTALARKMQQFAGWKLWQTEYCVMDGPNGEGGNGRDLTMTTALNVARVIHYDLTVAGVSAWQWWTAVSEADYKDGLIYTDWRKPGDPESIYPSRLLWTLGNYSRFVRPGMRRIELAGENHDLRGVLGSAFVDEKARRIVAVYLNEAAGPHRVDLRFDVGARPWRPRSLSLFVTSDRRGDELRHYPTLAVGNPIQLPARSVTTIVAEFDTGRE
jgi:hypothetical protein